MLVKESLEIHAMYTSLLSFKNCTWHLILHKYNIQNGLLSTWLNLLLTRRKVLQNYTCLQLKIYCYAVEKDIALNKNYVRYNKIYHFAY